MSDFVGTRADFITKYGSYVAEITKNTGIYPGTLFCQAILESQGKINGQMLVGGSGLARNAHNYFGIKASPGWNGKTYNAQTGEVTKDGQHITISSTFRAYDSIEESMRDYINFLQVNPRYRAHGVFNARNVPEQFAAIKAAGYATAQYTDLLNSIYKPLKSLIDQMSVPKKKVIRAGTVIPALLLVGSFFYLYKEEYN